MKLKQKGFTIIEMLIVIAIIGILATIVFVGFTNAKGKSNYSKTLADMNAIAKAVSIFSATHNGNFPLSDSGKINATDFTKYLSNWPEANVCPDYEYYYSYSYGQSGAGIYLKHNINYIGYIYYIGLGNHTACQMDGNNCVGGSMPTPSPTPFPLPTGEPIAEMIDKTAAAAYLNKPPTLIYDVPGKNFNCNAYLNYMQ